MTQIHKIDQLSEKLLELAPFHFVGIRGSGMAPLAEFTRTFNCLVTGSDRTPSKSPLYAKEGSVEDFAMVQTARTIVYSGAVPKNHPTLTIANKLGKTCYHRSDLLALFTKYFRTIAVAGTHGKSTTSAIIAHILEDQGLSPSWIIGAPFSNRKPAFCRGHSNLLVIEADESDGSFLKYEHKLACITNIDLDHLDFYESFESIKSAFREFVLNGSPKEQAFVFWKDSHESNEIAVGYLGKTLNYGESNGSSMQMLNFRNSGPQSEFDISFENQVYHVTLPLIGSYNAINALAAAACCYIIGVDPINTVRSLESFPGIYRRLQRYFSPIDVPIYDDYAHNPGKISNCLKGLRSAYPNRRIIVVFQPHRFSRVRSLYESFLSSFQIPDLKVIVLPVFGAGEPIDESYSAENFAQDIAGVSKIETFFVPSLKAAGDLVKSMIAPGRDLVVTIGAGDVSNICLDIST